MKGGLCIIYTSLLTVSVLSSCIFFILVVSEALQGDGDGVLADKVDLSGLHNVSQKLTAVSGEDVPKYALENEPKQQQKPNEEALAPIDQEMTFAEAMSLNSVTTDGLPDTGQPPIIISLGGNAKLDLRPDELLFSNESEEHNDTQTFSIVDSDEGQSENAEKESTEPVLIVKARPMHETKQTEHSAQSSTPVEESVIESQSEVQKEQEDENIPVKSETPQEDIPSFSEWAEKQLAEAEKKDTVLNHSSQPSHSSTNFSSKNTKLRSKNYASPACGAKVVAVNPEAGSASSILSPNRDEYMLNTCNSRIWFIVELCEAVQAQKIEIANFELFSSTPKDIAVYFSDRFPTREWASVGQFTAKDMRDVQTFDLFPHLFGKFIKVEMLSHHGSEHYCPISLFKVYGTSEFEVLEKESSQTANMDEDEDDDIIDVPDITTAESETSKNLFGSARDAVMSIMKKAAQALVKTEVPKNVSSEHNDTSTDKNYKCCCSPSHIIVCDNCSETLYNEVFELISCSSDKLTNLLRHVFLRDTLKCTGICQPFGLDFKSTKTIEFSSERVAYMNALFPKKYLAALCNMLAIKEKKVVLNTSFETELNSTSNITVDEPPRKINGETNSEQEVKLSTTNSSDDKVDETQKSEDNIVTVSQTGDNLPDTSKEEKDKINDMKEETLIEDNAIVPEQKEDTVTINTEEKFIEPNYDQGSQDINTKAESKYLKTETNLEKPKENGNGVDENNAENILIDNDSLMSDFDQMAVDPTPSGIPNSQNQNPAQTIQKESVFLRLSNRVKTLERNMSLSGQYLEELSRRYKKQVEEMQKSFEKTVSQMTEERKKSAEREQKYLEQMTTLQDQMAHMAAAITLLMEERDSPFGSMTFFKFLIFQSIVIAGVFYYFSKRQKTEPILVPIPKKVKKKHDKFRRKSVEGVSGHETPSAKKRRPSEEAMRIARQSTEEINEDIESGEWQVAKKNRRRKTSIVHRNMESDIRINGRQDSIRMQEHAIPLDEEEFFAPVSEPTEFNESMNSVKELPKTNGSIFNNLKAKTIKARRLSSPAFLRTLSRQSTRSNPSPTTRTPEPIYNGNFNKKAASESPTGSLWSESTEVSQNISENGGKKRKTLKNLFKKVF